MNIGEKMICGKRHKQDWMDSVDAEDDYLDYVKDEFKQVVLDSLEAFLEGEDIEDNPISMLAKYIEDEWSGPSKSYSEFLEDEYESRCDDYYDQKYEEERERRAGIS